MNSSTPKSKRRLPGYAKYLVVLGVVVFISFLFPNNVQFKYRFVEGQTWVYDDLRAPFDFPIKKTEAEVAEAAADIENEFSPYYTLDSRVADEQLAEFRIELEGELSSRDVANTFPEFVKRPKKYVDFGTNFLENHYQNGILKLDSRHADRSKGFVINITKGNTTRKETIGNLQTVAQLKKRLRDTLPITQLNHPELLLFTLKDKIVPNLVYNDSLTEVMKDRLRRNIVTTKGKVEKGELIATNGGIVTEDIYQKLLSFQEKYEEEITNQRSNYNVFSGYFLLTCLIMLVFLVYIRTYEEEIFQEFYQLLLLLVWFVVFSYLTFAVESIDSLSPYLIPYCIVPIIINHFYSDRIAFFTHVINILIVSFLTFEGYEFLAIQILTGFVAVLVVTDARNWNGFFRTIFAIGFTYAIGFFGLSLIKEGSFNDIPYETFKWIFLNMLLTMLAFPIIPLLEKIFGFTSSISLVELSDMSRPLLKQLSLKAPGTMQHSLQVANLAEAAAESVKANALLIKVAAMYHDIGKMEKPLYFIENQGSYNPHEQKSNIESAKIIIGHVTEGIKLAKKAGLPNVVIDFINTHHGTTRVEYFYRKEVKEKGVENVKESLFRYPGVRPKTKEETILMVADSIEAACRSIPSPTGQDIDKMIEKIIKYKIEMRQFEESELTFEELERCKIIFKKMLRSIHHVRVEYPEES